MKPKGNNRIVIPIGPQHPSLKEPGCFRILEEKVVHAEIDIGYNHRGLEKACEQELHSDPILIERVCGICSHTHSTAFCQDRRTGWAFHPSAGSLYPGDCVKRAFAQPSALAGCGRT